MSDQLTPYGNIIAAGPAGPSLTGVQKYVPESLRGLYPDVETDPRHLLMDHIFGKEGKPSPIGEMLTRLKSKN